MTGSRFDRKGPGRKLDWAYEHISRFQVARREFLRSDPQPYRVVRDQDTEPTLHIYRAYGDTAPPPYLGLIAADAIHALRSCLDQLAWNLARGKPSNVSFPIRREEHGPEGYCAKGVPMVRHMPEEVQRIIESLQPYRGGDTDKLATLNRLWNMDKHQGTPVIQAVGGVQSILDVFEGDTTIIEWKNIGPFKDGDAILRFRTTGAHPDAKPEADSVFDITFEKEGPARGSPVHHLLIDLHKYVRDDIYYRLTPFL